MSFVLRHNLTAVSLDHLLMIFNEHFPGMVPVTTYLFRKAYGQYGNYEPHFYCPACENYLGRNTGELQCAICCTVTDADSCLKSGCFFPVLSLASQIQILLEQKQTSFKKDWLIADTISDIEFGEEYQKLKESGAMGEDDISLIWNSTCQVIEFEPRERKANICLPCLWFGEKKPNMLTFLKPFVDELSVLEQNGITWTDSANVEHISKVFALICSSDSVTHPLLRNTKQFNGFYGCDFCYHVGGGPYTNKCPVPKLRTEAEHFDHALAATPEKPVMGIKGPSPLMKLENFQMINGFVPEYQHSVCLGVTRQLVNMWFDSRNHEQEWCIGTKSDHIDKELITIKPSYWKASEWRSFLLFYALPLLNGVLLKKFWNHLFLFCELWATSTFSFESFNGTLLNYFHGTTHVPEQIVKKFLCWRSLKQKAEKVKADANDGVKNIISIMTYWNCVN
ncbi:hypothetical protein ABG768_028154 [Culter alburnus]|uniref:Uncharacterized protein n=1 Tax=Culter alburnus TaxID=194366 RepID=A0AAW2A8T3_CULAL